MALFSKTTKKATKPKATKPKAAPKAITETKVPAVGDGRLHNVLLAPWFSEKALIGTENGVYVFAVPPDATGRDIANAIKLVYHVTPRKVNVVNLPGKVKSMRARRGKGTRARRHKAYVHLKKGDTITLA